MSFNKGAVSQLNSLTLLFRFHYVKNSWGKQERMIMQQSRDAFKKKLPQTHFEVTAAQGKLAQLKETAALVKTENRENTEGSFSDGDERKRNHHVARIVNHISWGIQCVC